MIGRQKICLLLSNDVIDFSQLAVYLPPQYTLAAPDQTKSSHSVPKSRDLSRTPRFWG